MTEAEWNRMPVWWQGAQWPRCKSCGHIAQGHDEGSCGEYTKGQCPTCGKWTQGHDLIQCNCKGYDGPTFTELLEKL